MDTRIEVETQGISDDWLRADSDFTTKSRGLLKADQMLSAMLHLTPLDTPDGADPCPPQITVRSRSGVVSFLGQGGSIYCLETETEMNAHQACDLAFGTLPVAPPPPMPSRPSARAQPAQQQVALPTLQKRKFGWRGGIVLSLSLSFLLGAVVMVFGVSAMRDRGVPSDDILAAITIGGSLGLVGILLLALAFKMRRTEFFNASGARVREDGSTLAFTVMGQSLGSNEGDDSADDLADDFADDFD